MFRRKKTTPISDPLLLHVENLEQRQMLAGDVSVALVGDSLNIFGDDSSNRIEIVSDGSTVTVSGQGTDLNGQDDPLTFAASNIVNYFIEMSDGNDRVTITATNDSGHAFGSQDVLCVVGETTGEGAIGIEMGKGNDQLNFIGQNSGGFAFFMNSLGVSTGDGNDRINFDLDGPNGIGARFMGISANAGNDRFSFSSGANTNGVFTERFGLLTDEGNDRIEFDIAGSGISTDDFTIGSGEGNDTISVEVYNADGVGIEVHEDLVLEGGEGNDRIEIIAENTGGTGMAVGNRLIWSPATEEIESR